MKRIFAGMLVVVTMAMLSMVTGCAQTLAHRNLEVNTKVSSTVDLNPDILSAQKPIYLLVRDQTSSNSGGESLQSLVTRKLEAKGYKVTKNSKIAAYRLLATFLYLDKAKEGMTEEGAIAGGFGGAILGKEGARYAHGENKSSLATNGPTSFLTTGLGSLTGSVVSVDSWYGIADITIEEPLQHAVMKKTKISSNNKTAKNSAEARVTTSKAANQRTIDMNSSAAASGDSESSTMDIEESATHKKMKTRIVGIATQTNIDKIAAETELKAQLSNAIANFF